MADELAGGGGAELAQAHDPDPALGGLRGKAVGPVARARWARSKRSNSRWWRSTASSTYSVIVRVSEGSTMRAIGTSGTLASAISHSMPAPSERIALRLGKRASSPGGARQTSARSISAGSPTSGQILTSSSGMRASSSRRQASAGSSGAEEHQSHVPPPGAGPPARILPAGARLGQAPHGGGRARMPARGGSARAGGKRGPGARPGARARRARRSARSAGGDVARRGAWRVGRLWRLRRARPRRASRGAAARPRSGRASSGRSAPAGRPARPRVCAASSAARAGRARAGPGRDCSRRRRWRARSTSPAGTRARRPRDRPSA